MDKGAQLNKGNQHRLLLEETGRRILDAVRTQLYLGMPFMGQALGSLGFVMDLSTTHVGTDAVNILFNPHYLMQTYLEFPFQLNRVYMHLLMHCLFRHMVAAEGSRDAELFLLNALRGSLEEVCKLAGANRCRVQCRVRSGLRRGPACAFSPGFPAGNGSRNWAIEV